MGEQKITIPWLTEEPISHREATELFNDWLSTKFGDFTIKLVDKTDDVTNWEHFGKIGQLSALKENHGKAFAIYSLPTNYEFWARHVLAKELEACPEKVTKMSPDDQKKIFADIAAHKFPVRDYCISYKGQSIEGMYTSGPKDLEKWIRETRDAKIDFSAMQEHEKLRVFTFQPEQSIGINALFDGTTTVGEVAEDSPCWKYGVRKGWIIKSVNMSPVDGDSVVPQIISARQTGEIYTITFAEAPAPVGKIISEETVSKEDSQSSPEPVQFELSF